LTEKHYQYFYTTNQIGFFSPSWAIWGLPSLFMSFALGFYLLVFLTDIVFGRDICQKVCYEGNEYPKNSLYILNFIFFLSSFILYINWFWCVILTSNQIIVQKSFKEQAIYSYEEVKKIKSGRGGKNTHYYEVIFQDGYSFKTLNLNWKMKDLKIIAEKSQLKIPPKE
jgi:hypothetical protein